MRRRARRWTTTLAALALWGQAALAAEAPRREPDAATLSRRFCEETLGGALWQRTELYFGLSRADGPDVTEEQFQAFVDGEVTPRFPDGLTLLSGYGQFRGASGTIEKEGSKLLVLLYPWSRAGSRAVDAIRARYKAAFHQEAVLRVDTSSCVSF